MISARTALLQRLVGVLLALAACWPVWRGVAVLAERDYLGCALTLVMAWLLARSGVELIDSADVADAQRQGIAAAATAAAGAVEAG